MYCGSCDNHINENDREDMKSYEDYGVCRQCVNEALSLMQDGGVEVSDGHFRVVFGDERDLHVENLQGVRL